MFGHGLYETAAQVLSTTCFGFAYAAARLRINAVWPLALLHGVDDFSNTHAANPCPPVVHLAYAVAYVGIGIWILCTVASGSVGGARGDPAVRR